MKIVLLGYMGSGKSEVGQHIAAAFNLQFIDLDHEIEKEEGSTVREIFETKGEIYFRKKETAVLQKILERDTEFVLALGGGTPCYGNNIQHIKDTIGATSVYLKTSLPELSKRLFKERDKRPLISHLTSEELLDDFVRKHLFERTFYYNQSDMTVTTDSKSPREISEEIMLKLH